jgi:hypothetical protein
MMLEKIPPPSDVSCLLQIIQASGSTIVDRYATHGQNFPSINVPFDLHRVTETLRSDPEVSRSIDLVVAAATQLITTLRDPGQTMFTTALSVSKLT